MRKAPFPVHDLVGILATIGLLASVLLAYHFGIKYLDKIAEAMR